MTTPATVLAQRDPIGAVALALIGLIIAMLAILASEGDSYPNVSASHVENPCVVVERVVQPAWGEEKPRPSARCSQV
jgi:hypothetical protein